MRYVVQQQSEQRWVIFDNTTQVLTRSRFHTRTAAEQWIELQSQPKPPKQHGLEDRVRRILRGRHTYGGRARAWMITDRDYYGTNERAIRAHNVAIV